MIAAAFDAIDQVFTRPFRGVFWKSIGLTLLLMLLVWLGLDRLVATATIHLPYAWLALGVHVLVGLGLVVGIALLVPSAAFIVAGFFFDELAGQVEEAVAGPQGRGRALPFGPALWIGLKFAGLSLLVNALALALLLVPGLNAVAFFGANAYLLGRGFAEFAALRYLPLPEVRALRRRHGLRLFGAGCVVAGLASIPLLNLLTPLFGAAFMVRVTRPLVMRALPPPRGGPPPGPFPRRLRGGRQPLA